MRSSFKADQSQLTIAQRGDLMTQEDMAIKLAEVDSRSKSNTKRLDKLEALTEVVHKLATTMKLMAEKQERTAEVVERLDSKITNIEQEPAKRWKAVVEKILMTVVAALVGFVMAKLGIT